MISSQQAKLFTLLTTLICALGSASSIVAMEEDINQQLINAATSGDLDEVKKFISRGADTDAVDDNRKTALHWAANKGNAEIVEYLLKKDNYTDNRDNMGAVPLLHAIDGKYVKIIKMLLNAGTSIYQHDDKGITVLQYARSSKHLETIRLIQRKLKEQKQKELSQQLVYFTYHGVMYADLLETFILNGADVNWEDKEGSTALHYAAQMEGKCSSAEDVKLVELLIKLGANVDTKDIYGFTPLMNASSRNWGSNAIPMLLKAGASIDAENNKGWTALDCTEDGWYLEKNRKLLLKAGAHKGSRKSK